MEVTIYVEASLKGPTIKDGRYAAIVEYVTESGKKIIRTAVGEEKKTTFHRLVLLGMLDALDLLRVPCKARVITDSLFVVGQAERKEPQAWMRSEWKTTKGTEVKNKNLWKQYLEQTKKHDITIEYGRHGEYNKKLGDLVLGNKEKAHES